jgi:hypothetical protein
MNSPVASPLNDFDSKVERWDATARASRASNKFTLLTADELEALPDPEWLIEGILPTACLGVLYGEPGAGKSFLALDWANHIAAGQQWFGRDVRGGNVIYVCAEGATGLKLRVRAWRTTHSGALNRLHFVTRAVNMLDKSEAGELIDAVRSVAPPPCLIIIDTLARCFGGGDENAGKDMNAFVTCADSFREAFPPVSVLVVHHTGKDKTKRERGHSALGAAADTMLRLSNKQFTITLQCEKQKDADTLKDLHLRLRKVRLAGSRSSCVIERASRPPNNKAASNQAHKLPSDRAAIDSLIVFGATGATFSAWQSASGLPPSTFKDAKKRLEEDELVARGEDGNWFAVRCRPEAESAPVLSIDARRPRAGQEGRRTPL